MILHLDGNAFFASVMQAAYPQYAGKPVVVGRERGIATAISYEARKLGITRGTHMWEIQKFYPQCIILDGDYALFSLFSKRMFSILRKYTPTVEEYSIDEAFAEIEDITIGTKIRDDIAVEIGIPVSVGISTTKCLAKQASESKKPRGVTVVFPKDIPSLLASISVSDIWGVGPATTKLLQQYGVKTALNFVMLPRELIYKRLTKPHHIIWNELQGRSLMHLDTKAKTTYQSIISSRTFSASKDPQFLWAQLRNHVEMAFSRARQFNYNVKKIHIMLKTQTFTYETTELSFNEPQRYPLAVIQKIKDAFFSIYRPNTLYRTTGCTITHLVPFGTIQGNIFTDQLKIEKLSAIYDSIKKHYFDLDFGTSLLNAHTEKKQRFTLPEIHV